MWISKSVCSFGTMGVVDSTTFARVPEEQPWQMRANACPETTKDIIVDRKNPASQNQMYFIRYTAIYIRKCCQQPCHNNKIIPLVCWGVHCDAATLDIWDYRQTSDISRTLIINLLITHMWLEHRLSALLHLHLDSRLNTCFQWIGQRQLQDVKKIV